MEKDDRRCAEPPGVFELREEHVAHVQDESEAADDLVRLRRALGTWRPTHGWRRVWEIVRPFPTAREAKRLLQSVRRPAMLRPLASAVAAIGIRRRPSSRIDEESEPPQLADIVDEIPANLDAERITDDHDSAGGEDSADDLMLFCSQCGRKAPPDADYCQRCGRPLRTMEADDGMRAQPSPLRRIDMLERERRRWRRLGALGLGAGIVGIAVAAVLSVRIQGTRIASFAPQPNVSSHESEHDQVNTSPSSSSAAAEAVRRRDEPASSNQPDDGFTFRGLRFGVDVRKQLPRCRHCGAYGFGPCSDKITCWYEFGSSVKSLFIHWTDGLEKLFLDHNINQRNGQLVEIVFETVPSAFEEVENLIRSKYGAPTFSWDEPVQSGMGAQLIRHTRDWETRGLYIHFASPDTKVDEALLTVETKQLHEQNNRKLEQDQEKWRKAL